MSYEYRRMTSHIEQVATLTLIGQLEHFEHLDQFDDDT